MRWVIIFTLLTQIGFTKSLNYYFRILEKNNLELKNQKAYIEISKNKTYLFNIWKNPILGIGINDILLSKNFFNRDIEAMQTQYITLSQEIPTNSKLKIQHTIATLQEKIYLQIYKDRVLRYRSILSKKLFSYQILQKKINIINRFLTNLKKIKTIKNRLISTSINSSKVINTDIYIVNLKLKKELIKEKIKTIKYEIEKLLYRSFWKISTSLKFNKVGKINLYSHPLLKAYRLKISQFDSKVALSKSKKIPNIKASIGYYNRSNRGDYISLNFSIPLPVTQREERNIKISALKLDQVKNEYKSYLNSFKKESQIYKKILISSRKNYITINSELKNMQKQLMFLNKRLITTQGSFISYLSTINLEYQISLQLLDEMQNYFNAYSKLIYYKGKQ